MVMVVRAVVTGLLIGGIGSLALACGKSGSATPPECKEMAATVERLEKCEKLPANVREMIKGQRETLDRQLKVLEGLDAPADQLKVLADTCGKGNTQMVDAYQKVAPECFK